LTEIVDPDVIPGLSHNALVAALGMREAAWTAVRERQQASDLSGLILAQMALELIDAAAHRRHDYGVFPGAGIGADYAEGADSYDPAHKAPAAAG
jgi:hypothetical protein